ncbi:MAG: hypothetical protein KDE51_09815 [Anaerolineales bacterium]|nr:hypothetical protein [Anaerolineales bacterium]
MANNNYQDKYEWEDRYDHLAREFHERGRSRQTHREKKHRADHQTKMSRREIVENIAAENDLVSDFKPTYLRNFDPKHHEYNWVMENLSGFYVDKIVLDVLGIVKAGKEANVYTCTGTESSGWEYIAAKVYRPRMLRNLSNDAIYKAGRLTIGQDGKDIHGRGDSREERAMKKKTAFGKKIDFATWIVHEYGIQQQLYNIGAAVPEPISHRNHTILMEYVGNAAGPAHTLIDTTLTAEEAPLLFDKAMDNIELMLAHHMVHGDLSAYNILYWQGDIKIIDFPQVSDARKNPHAFDLFARDVLRVCEYFQKYEVESDPVHLAADLWQDWLDGRL